MILVFSYRSTRFIVYEVAVGSSNILTCKVGIIYIVCGIEKIATGYFYFLSPIITVIQPNRIGSSNTALLTNKKIAGI